MVIVALQLSSPAIPSNDAADIHLDDWADAGLTHGTVARCAQLVRFTRNELQGYVGRLSRNDAYRVANAVLSVPASEKVWL